MKNTKDANGAFERRALLLHLGDVLEAVSRVMACGRDEQTVHDMVVERGPFEGFPLLTQVAAEMTAREFAQRAISAFCNWPQALLELELDRAQLAATVRRGLFAGNGEGWHAYVATLRGEVPWFGVGVEAVEGVEDDGRVTPAAQSGDEAIAAPDEAAKVGDVERDGAASDSASRGSVESAPGLYPAWPWKPEV